MALKPVVHDFENAVPVLLWRDSLEDLDTSHDEPLDSPIHEEYIVDCKKNGSRFFNQKDFNDLVRD